MRIFALALAVLALAPAAASAAPTLAQLRTENSLLRAQLAGQKRVVAAKQARIVTLTSDLATRTTERDQARAAVVQSVKDQIAPMENEALFDIVYAIAIAFEASPECRWDNPLNSGGGYSSVTFTRFSGIC